MKSVKKFQADIKEAKLTLTCIDNGATLLGMDACIKNNGKVSADKAKNTAVSDEEKALQQMGNLLKMLGN